MATQHPDHAGRPYWHSGSFVPTIEEAKECFLCLGDLGIDEYMWDWEGKLVDESVLERLLAEKYDFFKKNPLGKEKFLTFRLPNPKVETEFRLGRALMGIMSSAGVTKSLGLHSPPLFEVMLPMTESAEEMINIQEAFREIASLKHPLNKFSRELLSHIEIIPLFEQVQTIIDSDKILETYLSLHQKSFGFKPKYLRVLVARSDPALNSGIVPTVLGIKIAFSKYSRFEKKHGLKLHPIMGAGTLPFRGGINPIHPKRFTEEYKGLRTVTIQSAFRYDFPKTQVIAAIKKLRHELPKGKARAISTTDEKTLERLAKSFEKIYQNTIPGIAPIINKLAAVFPRRRERVQHIGLFGYSRGLGKIKLPRAISFTGVLYSLGIPPELIGTGRGLHLAKKRGEIKLVEKYYINLKRDLNFAGRFLYKEGLLALAKKSSGWKNILRDIEAIEKYLGKPLTPKNLNERKHQLISSKIHKNLQNGKNLTKLIEQSALLRKSMG